MQKLLLSALALGLVACPKPSGTNNPKASVESFAASAAVCKFTAAPPAIEVDECDYYVENILKIDGMCAKGEVMVSAEGIGMGGESQFEQLVNVSDKLQITVYQFEAEEAFHSFLVVRDLTAMKLFYYPLGIAEKTEIGTNGGELTVTPLKVAQLIPGGVSEVLVTVTHDFHLGNYSDNSFEGDTATAESVLWLGGPEPVWLGAATTATEHYLGPLVDDTEGPTPVSVKGGAKVEWSATGATISAISGQKSSAKEGSYSYGSLPSACLGQVKM